MRCQACEGLIAVVGCLERWMGIVGLPRVLARARAGRGLGRGDELRADGTSGRMCQMRMQGTTF